MVEKHPIPPQHFAGKNAVEHVAEAQAKGLIAEAEGHSSESAGYLAAAADSGRDTAIFLTILAAFLTPFSESFSVLTLLTIASFAWAVWKGGRSARLGWARLERLHRVLEQERWEIEHHRQQERDELKALYAAKGFSGQLLEEVMDVLMADGDRLLRVMVEEELGLSLEAQEHPIQQGFGAFVGSALIAAILIASYALSPCAMPYVAAGLLMATSSFMAHLEGNSLLSAAIWNLGIGGFTYAVVYFSLQGLVR